MKYKEFRVTVIDDKNVRARLPSGVTKKGLVETDYLKRQTIDFFSNWLASNKLDKREEMEIIGSHMYQVLFSGEIHEAFKTTYNDIEKQPDTGLRLVLEFERDARALATLPWEYIYFPDVRDERGFQIAAKTNLILTRQVPVEPSSMKPLKKPLRILIAVSQPKNTDMGQVLAEPVIKAIEELKTISPDSIEVYRMNQPNKRSFSEKIIETKPHVLHFMGHGRWNKDTKSGELAFVDENDQTATWIDDRVFADYFQDHLPRLIFLHACEGATSESYEGLKGVALQLVYSKIPAVVAMQYPIKNKTAIEFAKKFYQCLGEGKPIDEAVQEGRQELGMYLEPKNFSSRAFGSPVVYMQFLESPEGIVITKKDTSPPPPSDTNCPYCRNSIDANQTLCIHCHHLLTICPNCRRLMDETVGMCTYCRYGVVPSQGDTKAKPARKKRQIQGEPVNRRKDTSTVSITKGKPGKLRETTKTVTKLADKQEKAISEKKFGSHE